MIHLHIPNCNSLCYQTKRYLQISCHAVIYIKKIYHHQNSRLSGSGTQTTIIVATNCTLNIFLYVLKITKLSHCLWQLSGMVMCTCTRLKYISPGYYIVKLQTFLTFQLHGGECLAIHSGHGNITSYPMERKLGGPHINSALSFFLVYTIPCPHNNQVMELIKIWN